MESAVEPKYTFVLSSENIYDKFHDNNIRNLIKKWGINLQIQYFLFNEPFYQYHKYHLAQEFFKDQTVANNLKLWSNGLFMSMGLIALDVEVKQIPCSIMTMSFFDKIKNPINNIVHESGSIRQRLDSVINGIVVADNLRAMILDDELSNEYNLYSNDERDEFIFHIFQLLILGGEFCQYENDLKPYLDVTKALYKNLISIRKYEDGNMFISTIVLQVVAKCHTPYFPKDPDHKQNVGYILVDGINRKITTLLHQYT